MKKQIIINNIKKYNDYVNSYDVSNNIKTLNNNVIKEAKLSYIELLEKTTKLNTNDLCNNILDYYDNYEKQLVTIQNIQNIQSIQSIQSIQNIQSIQSIQTIYEKQHFIQALKKKLASYKQQDIKKNYEDYSNSNFITLENIVEKLISCSMKCYYCNVNILILFKNVREESQWTLDRLNNYDEHSNSNTIISCLKCNLQRRRKNSTKFKFSKQINIIKKIE
jgi:hypothetical protein